MAVTLPTTPLAVQADLESLALAVSTLSARVTVLEHTTPPVSKVSPDGSFVVIPGSTLTDKNLAGYSLVADTVRPPFRVARGGTTDPVTGNVSKIGIYNQGQC